MEETQEKLTVGSCFSGIGGLELGLERTGGFETKWQIENDPYASAVLVKHWPDVPRFGDIRTVNHSRLERPDLICGGYPCQPFSLAGERAGENDARHLWPHFLTIICLLRPRFCLLENVPGHLSLGFGRVLGDLAECGYDAEWQVLSAAGAGAPHLRRRIFVVAYLAGNGWGEIGTRQSATSSEISDANRNKLRKQSGWCRGTSGQDTSIVGNDGAKELMADTNGKSEVRSTISREKFNQWKSEPDVGRVAHGVPSRVDRLRCLGNAVVPAVAEKVGRMILAYENSQS